MQCAPLDHSHSHVNTGQRQRRGCGHAVALQLGMALQQTVGTLPRTSIQARAHASGRKGSVLNVKAVQEGFCKQERATTA